MTPDPVVIEIPIPLLSRVQTLAQLYEAHPQVVLAALDQLIQQLPSPPTLPAESPWTAIYELQARLTLVEAHLNISDQAQRSSSMEAGPPTQAASNSLAWDVWVVDPVRNKHRKMERFESERAALDRARQLEAGIQSVNQERREQGTELIRYEIRPVADL